MIVRAAPSDHFPWLVSRVGCAITPAFRAIEAVDVRGNIRGMVGFDLWTANSVQAHMAVDTPIAWRSLLRPAFRYPFLEGGRGLILGIISAANAKSLAMARGLGFHETHRIRDGQSVGVDLVVMEMRREHCRWIERRAA